MECCSHIDPMKENKGAIRAQEDWAKLVGPVKHYKGGLGAEFTFIRVTVPECLPERLEILSYANEFAFLYDGGLYLLVRNLRLLTGCRCHGEH